MSEWNSERDGKSNLVSWLSCGSTDNCTPVFQQNFNMVLSSQHVLDHSAVLDERPFSLVYRVVATLLHVLIFICGTIGNVVLIIVAHRTLELQTPTYCYLVSLAYADLIVLVSAMPEAIMFHQIGPGWILGQAGCSILVFANFLGINAGSMSILVFTVERYIAVLQPMLAQKVCTLQRARKVIIYVWIFSTLYCAPWLGLTEVRPEENNTAVEHCDFRLSQEQYVYFFAFDLVLFYFVPLTLAVYLSTKIAIEIHRTKVPRFPGSASGIQLALERISTVSRRNSPTTWRQFSSASIRTTSTRTTDRGKSRKQALRMLLLVVILFAVCWLPFRGLLVYNSFAEEQWLELWYLLFAKTLIYLNSAINPFLYNAMSVRFRKAVYRTLCWSKNNQLRSRKMCRVYR